MEKLTAYVSEHSDNSCVINFNMVVHSLGNYLFKNFVESDVFSGETGIFNNVILHQADCDNKNHAQWVERLSDAGRVFVTINKRDRVLSVSDKVNPDRLGNTVKNLNADNATYIDFTGAESVGTAHRLWKISKKKNPKTRKIFKQLFTGERPEQGSALTYYPTDNVYRL